MTDDPLLAVFFGHSQEADVLDLTAVRLSERHGAQRGDRAFTLDEPSISNMRRFSDFADAQPS
jgi:hypothetical protein